MAGRPEKYTDELFNEICDEISHSDKGLVFICKDKGINAKTFYDWIASDTELSNKYARCRELQAEFLADEIIEISNTTIEGVVIETDDNGRTKEKKGDMLGHRRLQIDARKWKASKLYPKKYGDKLDVTTQGEKVNVPTQIILSNGTTIDL